MKRLGQLAALLLACLGMLSIVSCGGGGATPTISITLTTADGILSVDESQPTAVPPVLPALVFTAAVGGDTKNQGVTWPSSTVDNKNSGPSLTGASCSGFGTGPGQCGTITNATAFSATYTPPSNLSASQTITLKVASISDSSATQTATITVVLPPTFTATSCIPSNVINPCGLASGNNGVPYSTTISFTGGVQPYTFNNVNASLSTYCLTLNTVSTSTTTTLVGTPCNTGTTTTTVTFTLTVTDNGGTPSISQEYSINLAPAPTLSVTTSSLPPGTLDAAYNAKVSVQGGVAPLKWDFEPTAGGSLPTGDIAGLPPGLVASALNGQIAGIPTDQSAANPPVTYPATYSFTVQVHDSSLPSPGQIKPATPLPLSITIQKPQTLSITTQGPLPQGTTAAAYAGGALQASGGVLPYTWKITQGLLPAGLTLTTLNDGSGSISGTPILATPPAGASFTVQVSDSRLDPVSGNPNPATASKTFAIIVLGATDTSNNKLLSGTYALLFRGFDDDGLVVTAGQITANGSGVITAGTEDTNHLSGVLLGATVTGTYTIGSDGRGTLELISTFANTAPLTEDYVLVLDSSGNARFFEDNHTTTSNPKHAFGEGILKPAVGSTLAASDLNGNYALLFAGGEAPPTASKPAALAGRVHADGVSALTAGNSDLNDSGTFTSQTISGDFAVGSSGNRGTATLTYQVAGKPQTTLTFIFYFVTPSDLFWVEADADSKTFKPTMFRLAGEMVLQQPTTTFNQNVLQGSSVATGTGVASGGNGSVFAGLLDTTLCDGNTPLSLNSDDNSAGTITAQSFSGTCAVTSDGRVVFNLAGIGNPAPAPRINVGYLTGPGAGFLLGGDAAVTIGLLEQQTGQVEGAFLKSSLLGGYTLSEPFLADAQTKNVVGQITADGGGNFAGVVDETDPPATGAPNTNQALIAAIDIGSLQSSGRGTMTASGTVPHGFPTNAIFYIVSPGNFRAISDVPGDQHPELLFFDH